MMQHEGGCLCGAVRYQTTGDPLRVTVCHCKWCQRRTGTGFAVEPIFTDAMVTFNDLTRKVYRSYSDTSGRWLDLEFCPDCGTTVGFTLEWRPGLRIIDAGTFDDPGWINPVVHDFRYIYLRSAQSWSEVPSGAEVFDAHFAT
jgi:hypothetical protein